MTWTNRHTLFTGLALIVLSNAVALLGVAYNRSDTTATLKMTERELTPPYRWRGSKENSGLALSLQWRVMHEENVASDNFGWSYPRTGGAPKWLDKAKLEALGFSARQLDTSGNDRDFFENQLSRTVFLVLELDGPAYQASLERARRFAELKANKEAQALLEREQIRNSRLFVVDAGLDPDALHAKYPDRSRHAVVRGQVRLRAADGWYAGKALGYVSAVSVGEVSVPFGFRDVFDFVYLESSGSLPNANPFEVTINFGKRHEPWIASASGRK